MGENKMTKEERIAFNQKLDAIIASCATPRPAMKERSVWHGTDWGIGLFCLFLGLFVAPRCSKHVHADEPVEWLCTTQASQQNGHVIKACGVGTGTDENAARLSALQNANAEFKKVCGMSEDCHGHAVTAQPMRTTCQALDNEFLCHRLVAFTILDQPTRRVADPGETQMKPYEPESDSTQFMKRYWKSVNATYFRDAPSN